MSVILTENSDKLTSEDAAAYLNTQQDITPFSSMEGGLAGGACALLVKAILLAGTCAVVGGSVAPAYAVAYPTNGSAVVGASCDIAYRSAMPVAGGAVASQTVLPALTAMPSSIGGQVAGGAGFLVAKVAPLSTAGSVVGGNSALARRLIPVVVGGAIVVKASSPVSALTTRLVSSGAVASGSSDKQMVFSLLPGSVPSASQGGTAVYKYVAAMAANGGSVANGVATVGGYQIPTAIGGMVAGGSSFSVKKTVYGSSNGTVAGGQSTLQIKARMGLECRPLSAENSDGLLTEDDFRLITEPQFSSEDGAVVGGTPLPAIRKSTSDTTGGGVANTNTLFSSINVQVYDVTGSGGNVVGGRVRIKTFQVLPHMKDWLVKRLTPVKRLTTRWNELAQALQNYWETLFDTEFTKLYNLQSIYTADNEGQRRIISELGDYFDADIAIENRPIAVAMRKLELMMKDTDYPIRMAIQRAGIQGVEWAPLWALEADGPYGTKFYDKYTGVPNGSYLTSRGVLVVDLALVTQQDLVKIDALVSKIKPLHIVYDGTTTSATDRFQSFSLVTENLDPIISEDNKYIIT